MKALKIIGLWLGLVALRIVLQPPLQWLADAGGSAEGVVSALLSLAITIVFILVGVFVTSKINDPAGNPVKALKITGLWLGLLTLRFALQLPFSVGSFQPLSIFGTDAFLALNITQRQGGVTGNIILPDEMSAITLFIIIGVASLIVTILFIWVGIIFTKKIRRSGK